MSSFAHLTNIVPSYGPKVFVYKLNEEIAKGLKTLMEEKGLYQSVSFDWAGALQFTLDRVPKTNIQEVKAAIVRSYPHSTSLALSEEEVHIDGGNTVKEPVPTLSPINYKLHCSTCRRTEAFKPVWFQDATNALNLQRLINPKVSVPKFPTSFQLFNLLYQCQSCLGTPEAFLIRRSGLKLAMHGRSPIESVAVPQSIPEPESNWYRESVIAMKFGRTLAAIFYLRVFIEQFARRVTDIRDRRSGDEILSAYTGAIADPPRSSMPSLKEWYGKLSEAIHAADEDSEMLKSAFEEVDRHFEFRKLYQMSDTPPKKPSPDSDNAGPTEQA